MQKTKNGSLLVSLLALAMVVVLGSCADGDGTGSNGSASAVPKEVEADAAPRSEPNRVSSFGEYEGYTESQYHEWVRSSQYVEMRDGVQLAVDVVRPAIDGVAVTEPLPAIYTMQRYGRSHIFPGQDGIATPVDRESHLRELVKSGYVYVSVGIRGTGASFGVYPGVYSANEARDTYDVADWITEQPWSNGHLGMMGNSYRANASLMAASMPHPALKAIFPSMMDFDIYLTARPGGVLLTGALKSWTQITAVFDGKVAAPEGAPFPTIPPVDDDEDGALFRAAQSQHQANANAFNDSMARLYRDGYEYGPELHEDENVLSSRADAINTGGVATYFWSGWRDIWPVQPLLWMANLNVPKRLVMGPWSHDPDERDAEGQRLPQETARIRLQTVEMMRWFDYWLKDIDNGIMDEPPITYSLGDSHGQWTWRNADAWHGNADATLVTWHLDENAGLTPDASPARGSGSDAFIVDKSATTGPRSRWIDATSFYATVTPDIAANADKGLVYVTEPADAPFAIIGHPIVTLYVSASAPDTDVFVYLERVTADGDGQYLTEGNLRASHRTLGAPPYDNLDLPWPTHARQDVEAATPLTEDTAKLHFAMLPIAEKIDVGERLRLTITGADADNFELPPTNTPTTITVERGGSQHSFVSLPVFAAE